MSTIKNDTEKKVPEKDAYDAVRKLFEQAEKNVLPKMAMWMRYNYILSNVEKLLDSGYSEADINWQAVNQRLYTDVNPYDNNMHTEVHSVEQLREAREQCIESSVLNLAWRKGRCKDCHKEFTLSYSECSFFESKGLNLPKRCKCCRDKRKEGMK